MTQYRLPPEWQRQSGVILAWPHRHSDWAGDVGRIDPVYAALAAAISREERLIVVHYDAEHRAHIERQLAKVNASPGAIHFYECPTNDTWVRDSAAITVLDAQERAVLLDFTFNGWGGKYDASLDNQLTACLHRRGAFGATRREVVDVVLEGGSIEVDGRGTLLTTTACLLAETRNPQLSLAELQRRLGALLGVERFLWLRDGYLRGDDTDSHVDMLARFCAADTIAYVRCDDPADEHFPALQRMQEQLRGFRQADGQAYRLVALPWPSAKYSDEGERLPASYANFLILNQSVLVPTYDDPADAVALQTLADVFPGREMVAIPSLALIAQRGSIHCATMQLPAAVQAPSST
jgi:agmatine deiminase